MPKCRTSTTNPLSSYPANMVKEATETFLESEDQGILYEIVSSKANKKAGRKLEGSRRGVGSQGIAESPGESNVGESKHCCGNIPAQAGDSPSSSPSPLSPPSCKCENMSSSPTTYVKLSAVVTQRSNLRQAETAGSLEYTGQPG